MNSVNRACIRASGQLIVYDYCYVSAAHARTLVWSTECMTGTCVFIYVSVCLCGTGDRQTLGNLIKRPVRDGTSSASIGIIAVKSHAAYEASSPMVRMPVAARAVRRVTADGHYGRDVFKIVGGVTRR